MNTFGKADKTIWLKACVAWDSLALFVVCLADMLSTLYWVHTRIANESNPWLADCLRHGDTAFCLQKLLSFVPLLLFCAYYRSQRPRLIAISLRGGLALYLLFYAVSVTYATYYA